MIRWRQYKFVLIVFVICWLTGMMIGIMHRAAIRDMVNEAGRKSEPIFVISYLNEDSGSSYSLINKDWDRVPLLANGNRELILWFETTGNLLATGYLDGARDRINGTIRLPDYRIRNFTRRPLDAHSSYNNPTRSQNKETNSRWWAWPDGLNGVISFSDILTGEYLPEYVPYPQLVDPAEFQMTGYAFSHDGSVLFSVAAGAFLKPHKIFRCEIETGKWSEVTTVESMVSMILAVGPNGDLIAVQSSIDGPPGKTESYIDFLDGHNGTLVKRIDLGEGVVIGKRWVSYLSMTNQYGHYGPTHFLFDMENDWERTLVTHGALYQGVAMYEPPPNGLDGMYENYDPDAFD